MPIDFHDKNNQSTYAMREATLTWNEKIEELVDVKGKRVADIGCGGGIYSKALVDLGATMVTGVDFSEHILSSACTNCSDYPNIKFVCGNANNTNLPDGEYDLILTRALIHHLQDLHPFFLEAHRLLKSNGILLIQDRTPEDCLLEGSQTHIRGYFFEKFPNLVQTETSRRHSNNTVIEILDSSGFSIVESSPFWETRRSYNDIESLAEDLQKRTGRSILHELSDTKLDNLITYIREQLAETKSPIVEKDRWTIWKAVKK